MASFFSLPTELRNEVYHLIAEPENEEDEFIYFLDPLSPTARIAQVNQQFRVEFLPIYHTKRHLLITFGHMCKEWLDIFGESRLPLHRNVDLAVGDVACEVIIRRDGTVATRPGLSGIYGDSGWRKEYERLEELVAAAVRWRRDGSGYLTKEGVEMIEHATRCAHFQEAVR